MVTEAALLEIYRGTLARCSPPRLTRERLSRTDLQSLRETEVDLVALGKCASGLVEGAISHLKANRVFVAMPAGYVSTIPSASGSDLEVVEGSHPELSTASFRAGERLFAFVESSQRPIVFLISGGSSACVELPLRPWFDEDDLIAVNRALIRSGLPIASINLVRRHLSAIKGGRLGALAPSGSSTMIYSDVSPERVSDVGSGPTIPDTSTNHQAAAVLSSLGDACCTDVAERLSSAPETPDESNASGTYLIADSTTLRAVATDEATRRGMSVDILAEELEEGVADVVDHLVRRLGKLGPDELLVAGGEPTVAVRGEGVGGRCSELAVRFAAACDAASLPAVGLFGSSDGLDGNTGAAGIVLSAGSTPLDRASIDDAIARSDTFSLASQLGSPIVTGATGNNLRDLYLVARK